MACQDLAPFRQLGGNESGIFEVSASSYRRPSTLWSTLITYMETVCPAPFLEFFFRSLFCSKVFLLTNSPVASSALKPSRFCAQALYGHSSASYSGFFTEHLIENPKANLSTHKSLHLCKLVERSKINWQFLPSTCCQSVRILEIVLLEGWILKGWSAVGWLGFWVYDPE